MEYSAYSFIILMGFVFVHSSSKGIFHFDQTGFEHCIFNLVDYSSRESGDLTDSVLNQNQGIQLSTIKTLTNYTNFELKASIIDTKFLKESCSVNVLIVIDPVRMLDGYAIFGYRFHSTKNTLLIFLGEDVPLGPNIHFSYQIHAVIDIVLLRLSKDNSHVQAAACYCHSCPPNSIMLIKNFRFQPQIQV